LNGDKLDAGQAIADGIFRGWQNAHKDIKVTVINANENIGNIQCI
jgi:hypothetical protein